MTLWNDLLGNLAVVAICTSLWTFGNRWMTKLHPWMSSAMLSAVMTAGVLAVMLMPFEFQAGVYLDLRYTLIAVSGFFGGPLALISPVVTALATRYVIGGTGIWIGITHILLTAASVLVLRSLSHRHLSARWILSALAAAVTFSGTIGFFFVIPQERWLHVLATVIAPFSLVLMTSTLIACLAILQEQRRQKVTNENLIYRAIIEALPDCLNAKDLEGRFIAANPATAALMQAGTVSKLLGQTDFDFYPLETAREFRHVELQLMKHGEPLTVEQRFTLLNGSETWLSTLKAPIRNEDGEVVGLITHNREITAQKHMETQLVLAQQRLAEAVSTMADGLAMFDANGNLVFRNSQYLELFPLTADIREVGVSLKDILRAAIRRGEDPAAYGCMETIVERTYASLLTAGTRQMHLTDGRWIEARTRATAEGGAMIVFTDITDLKNAEAQLQAQNNVLSELAATDGLTGLANRRAFDEALIQHTLQSGRLGHDVAMLLIDVDRFKAYNDTYGHQAGDVCLQAVARCIKQVMTGYPDSHVARYGGEEFAILVPNIDSEEARDAGLRVCDAVRSAGIAHDASEKQVVTVSIGVAMMSRKSGRRITDLVEDADRGLYRAKSSGRDKVVLSDKEEGPSFAGLSST